MRQNEIWGKYRWRVKLHFVLSTLVLYAKLLTRVAWKIQQIETSPLHYPSTIKITVVFIVFHLYVNVLIVKVIEGTFPISR